MNQSFGKCARMEGFKVVVLPIDVDASLADRLVEDINSCAGSDIAVKCLGTPGTILEKANKKGIGFVVFYGSLEEATKRMTIREMVTREQYGMPIDGLPEYFASRYK